MPKLRFTKELTPQESPILLILPPPADHAKSMNIIVERCLNYPKYEQ
jgi:hypothetical protein